MKRIHAFFLPLVFIAPLWSAEISHEEKSEDTSDHYTISNPLVLLVGIEKYPYCSFDDLPGVESDMKILHRLFSVKCGYEVRSTYHKGDTYVGKAVRKEEFDDFVFDQYIYLRKKRKLYDALIFAFSGHGGGDYDGRDTIITSEGKETLFCDIEGQFTRKADDPFLKDFVEKPKIFFKLACRNKIPDNLPSVINTRGVNSIKKKKNACSEVITFYATSAGYCMRDVNKFVSSFSDLMYQSLGKKKLDLLDIDRKIKQKVYEDQAPRSTTGLTKKVFFSPKIKRKPLDKATKKQWWEALENGEEETVKDILANYIVDVNAKYKYGYTLLHDAAMFNKKEVAEILLQHGTDVNAKDGFGRTPLHYAAMFNKKEVAEILLEHGADVNAKDNNGDTTPLHIASEKKRKEVAEILLQHGANVNAKDNYGWTPLHNAAYYNSIEVAEILIREGGDKSIKNNYNLTPLDVAKQKGYKEMIELLKPKGIFSIFGL